MPHRSLVALTVTAALLGGSIAAAGAAPGHHHPKAGTRAVPAASASAGGVVSDWDGTTGVVAVDAPALVSAPRAVRRAIRRGAGLELTIGPRTRVVTVDADGARQRVSAAALFEALDVALDDVDVEARGTVERGALPGPDRMVDIAATRVVVHLPAADDGDVADPGDDLGDVGDPGDEPPSEDDPGLEP